MRNNCVKVRPVPGQDSVLISIPVALAEDCGLVAGSWGQWSVAVKDLGFGKVAKSLHLIRVEDRELLAKLTHSINGVHIQSKLGQAEGRKLPQMIKEANMEREIRNSKPPWEIIQS